MLRKLVFLGLAGFAAKKLIDRSVTANPATASTGGQSADTLSETGTTASQPDTTSIGHAPTDLGGDTHPDGSERADDHFRPDSHATIPPEDREGLRPVTFEPARQPAGI